MRVAMAATQQIPRDDLHQIGLLSAAIGVLGGESDATVANVA